MGFIEMLKLSDVPAYAKGLLAGFVMVMLIAIGASKLQVMHQEAEARVDMTIDHSGEVCLDIYIAKTWVAYSTPTVVLAGLLNILTGAVILAICGADLVIGILTFLALVELLDELGYVYRKWRNHMICTK